VEETPQAQEVTSARVPEAEPIPKPFRGTLRDEQYKSDWLGVTAAVPSGMHATVSEEAEFAVRKEGESYGALFISDRVHTDGYNAATFDALHADAVEGAGIRGLELEMLSSHVATTSLGKGVARLWGARGTNFRMRVILVPVCFGTGSYVFVQAYGDDQGQKVIDGWIDSFRWLSLDPPQICKKLNPR
jgi:hypothetical protein